MSGTHCDQPHLGTLVPEADRRRHLESPLFAGNMTNLAGKLNLAPYPSPHSDIVALLLLDHQVTLLNRLTRVNFESRFGRSPDSEEQLLRDLLLIDAPPLTAAVKGTSGYAAWFEQQGPRDAQGRSLRQLDLQTRLFKYRCSPLIYSPVFTELPDPVRARLYQRLWDVLTGRDVSPPFQAIPAADRTTLREILQTTLTGLPAYWKVPADAEGDDIHTGVDRID